MESLLKHRAHDIAILREEINLLRRKDGCVREQFSLLARKDGCFFLQPSSPQDSETLSEPFPVLTPCTVTNSPSVP